jgi:uncharacterized protein GlcG (DUF336 family)
MIRPLVMLGAGALVAATSSIANAQQPPAPPARAVALALALEAAQTAIDTCSKEGFKVAGAVVDAEGGQKVFLAADGASKGAVESSVKKATTALRLKAATSDVIEKMKTDAALKAKVDADQTLFVRPGGILVMAGNDIIGAFGVGGVPGPGGGGAKDEACAKAGLDKIKDRIK